MRTGMEVKVNSSWLKQEIIKYVTAGEVHIQEGKVYFDGKPCNGPKPSRLVNLLLFTEEEKYQSLAFDIIDAAQYNMCHFTPMIMSRVLFEYGGILPQRCAAKIKEYLLRVKPEFIGSELDFVGVNDNFPMMSAYTAFAEAKIFQDDQMYQEGVRRLRQLEALLKRRGVISEYNSMTYTPLQLFVLASLSKIVPNEELKEIVINAQRRIWADFIAHFHPGTGDISGPFSRHYIRDVQTAHKFFYTLFQPEIQLCIPDFEEHSGAIEVLYYLTETYECDKEIIDLIYHRKYPFEVSAITEYSSSTDATPEAAKRDMRVEEDFYEYAGGTSGLYTYQTEYYGIGTSTNEWHNGVQTSSFILNYKRKKKIETIHDAKMVYCRYLLNDEEKEKQSFMDQGRKMVFGKKNRAIVLYKPKVAAIPAVYSDLPEFLAEHYKKQEVSGNKAVTSAKLVIVIPNVGIGLDKIVVDTEQITQLPATFKEPKSVYIQDGEVYMAFHPLHITDLGRENAMTITERNGNLEISFYNYAGEKRDFAKREFIHARNGFAVSVGSTKEFGDFEAFMNAEKETEICDEYMTSNHARQTFARCVSVVNGDEKLSCEYTPASEGIKNIAYCDYPIEFLKLSMTGVNCKDLPYMQ